MRLIAVGPLVSELKPENKLRKTSLLISELDATFSEDIYGGVHQILLIGRNIPSLNFMVTAASETSHISTTLRDQLRIPKAELNRNINIGMLTCLTDNSRDVNTLRTVVDAGTFAGWPSVLVKKEISGTAGRIYYSDVFIYVPEFAALL